MLRFILIFVSAIFVFESGAQKLNDSLSYSNMNEKQKHLFRWANATIGLALSPNERILFVRDHSILITKEDRARILLATSDFHPDELSPDLRKDLLSNVEAVFIGDFGYASTAAASFHVMPTWLSQCKSMKSLGLSNVAIGDLSSLTDLPLRALNLKKVNVVDKELFMRSIGQFQSLQYFFYDDAFSEVDMKVLRLNFPNVKFIYKN